MVKIHDGSLVPASELLSNNGEDDEGNKLEFKQVKDATYPTYEAKSDVPDDTGRKRTYRFSFEDTNVTVHMTTTEEEKEAKEEKATEKSVKEVKAEPESKKNSSSSSEPVQKLNPPDYRLRKSNQI